MTASRVAVLVMIVSALWVTKVAASPAATTDAGPAKLGKVDLSARQAGAHYGQAVGVPIICYDLKTTKVVNDLRAQYQDRDLAAFDAEAAKILSAWRTALTCRQSTGPNECRLSHLWSCQQAWSEIGPEGTAVPGLIEPKKP